MECRREEEEEAAEVELDFLRPRIELGKIVKGDLEVEEEGAEDLRGAFVGVEVGGVCEDEGVDESLAESAATGVSPPLLVTAIEFDTVVCDAGGVCLVATAPLFPITGSARA